MITPATTQAEVDRRIDAWHDGWGAGMALHTYLGWTLPEYARWVETNELPTTSTPSPIGDAPSRVELASPAQIDALYLRNSDPARQ